MSIRIQLPNEKPQDINGRLGTIITEFVRQLLEAAEEDSGIANEERSLNITASCQGKKVRLSIQKFF